MADPETVKRKSKQKVIIDSIWNRRSLFGFMTSDRTVSQRHTEEKHKAATLNSEMVYKWSKKEKTKSVTEDRSVSTPGENQQENQQEVESQVKTTFRYNEESQHYCFVSAFGKKGKKIGEFQDAKTISCSPQGKVLVSDYVNSRLQICSDLSKMVTVFSPHEIALPWAAVVTRENNIAVTLCQDRCVKVFNMDGDVITTFGKDHFMKPTGIATDKNGQKWKFHNL